MITNENATAAQVCAVPLRDPIRAGAYWQGVKHSVLVDTLHAEISRRGWKYEQSRYHLSSDNRDLVGTMRVTIPGVRIPHDIDLAMGFVNSNSRRRALKIVIGSIVRVCQNGVVWGESVLTSKKHTSGFNLEAELRQAVTSFYNNTKYVNDQLKRLKEKELTDAEVNDILMEAGRDKLLAWSYIGMVDKEYHNPSYDEFHDHTAWSLLNAFSLIAKQSPPAWQLERMGEFRALLTKERSTRRKEKVSA